MSDYAAEQVTLLKREHLAADPMVAAYLVKQVIGEAEYMVHTHPLAALYEVIVRRDELLITLHVRGPEAGRVQRGAEARAHWLGVARRALAVTT